MGQGIGGDGEKQKTGRDHHKEAYHGVDGGRRDEAGIRPRDDG